MSRGTKAAAVILLILVAGAAFLYLNPFAPEPTPLTDTESNQSGTAEINEVRPSNQLSEEFIELYTTGSIPDTEGWILTTYDDDRIILPALTGNGNYSYIRIYTGGGQNDLDVSDNQATIYGEMDENILEITGDEVGLHDADGNIIDFIRFGGGNGDPVFGTWDEDNSGPDAPDSGSSLSLFGAGYDDQEWLESPPTPGEPNVVEFAVSGQFTGTIQIISGTRKQTTYTGGIDDSRLDQATADNVTVIARPGVNASVVRMVKEHIAFSLNFFAAHGFTNPEMALPNKVLVVIDSGADNDTTAETTPRGVVHIHLGQKATKEELKAVGEHEVMHLYHFGEDTDENGDNFRHLWFFHRWFVEGQAEFWGLWSMLENYPHMTLTSWMRMAQRIGGLNWFDHYRDMNSTGRRGPFGEWWGSWHNYMAVYLFTKWMNETFGEDALFDIYNKTRYYGPNDPRNVDPNDVIQEVLGMTLAQAMAQFWAWLVLHAPSDNGVPARTPHVSLNYTGDAVNDTVGVLGGGGAVIEEVNMQGGGPFTLRLNRSSTEHNFTITIIVFYDDGSNETITLQFEPGSDTIEIPVDPSGISKIWIIKGLVTPTDAKITMGVNPATTE